MSDAPAFTLVFAGDIRKFKMNPLVTQTPWGIPYAVACWDALEKQDELEAALKQTLTDPPSTFDEPDTDAEVLVKLRQIAREALNTTKGTP